MVVIRLRGWWAESDMRPKNEIYYFVWVVPFCFPHDVYLGNLGVVQLGM